MTKPISQEEEGEKVEVIERWVHGCATEYSVDGGKHWFSKAQFNYIQALLKSNRNTLLDSLVEEVKEAQNLGEYEDWGSYGEGFGACRDTITETIRRKKL